ncbi:hypothetical protein [Natranaerobius trueperi]|uniref:Uncharacterized protein n=1 Tax=Natranaerobius trueperi TaxID=759412 RepID=A0A226BZF5_9FIRM|nr:hypothetical protein [Natranaerobius trueperi]OWZ83487.1 hypothetical protein CDO51_08295 [Natranaerobius trueperi]
MSGSNNSNRASFKRFGIIKVTKKPFFYFIILAFILIFGLYLQISRYTTTFNPIEFYLGKPGVFLKSEKTLENVNVNEVSISYLKNNWIITIQGNSDHQLRMYDEGLTIEETLSLNNNEVVKKIDNTLIKKSDEKIALINSGEVATSFSKTPEEELIYFSDEYVGLVNSEVTEKNGIEYKDRLRLIPLNSENDQIVKEYKDKAILQLTSEFKDGKYLTYTLVDLVTAEFKLIYYDLEKEKINKEFSLKEPPIKLETNGQILIVETKSELSIFDDEGHVRKIDIDSEKEVLQMKHNKNQNKWLLTFEMGSDQNKWKSVLLNNEGEIIRDNEISEEILDITYLEQYNEFGIITENTLYRIDENNLTVHKSPFGMSVKGQFCETGENYLQLKENGKLNLYEIEYH